MKKTIMFDATILLNVARKNSGRSGIFYTAYNIASILNNNKNIDLVFYIDVNQIQELKDVIQNYIPEFKNVKIWSLNKQNYFIDIIDFMGALKQYAKKANHKIIAEFFHISGLLSKILFFIPYKIAKLNKNKVNADIFLSPVLKIPYFLEKNENIKKYTIVYDVIPYILPEHNKAWGDIDNYWLGILVNFMKTNNTDKYFAISKSSRDDFLKLVPSLKPEQIIITPLACSDNFYQSDKKQTLDALKKYNLPLDKKYVFSLCSLEPRKNLIRAVKTFIEFIKKNNIDDMVFVMGGGHWDSFIEKLEQEIADLGEYKDKIIKAGYIDDEDLAALYSGAEFFVYTSQYEGFGLPPLEAMKCGCPVITSNNSSLPEVVGDAGIMIDWDSDEQHIAAYEKYYFDEKYRDSMAKKGLERAKMFSWDKTVDIMLREMLKDEK